MKSMSDEQVPPVGERIQSAALTTGLALGLVLTAPLFLVFKVGSAVGNGNGIGDSFGLIAVGMIATSPIWGPAWVVGKAIALCSTALAKGQEST